MDTNIITQRPYAGEPDLQPLCDMLNACDAVDQQDDSYAVDDLRSEFTDPRLDAANDLRLWQDANGQLVAFGQTWIERAGEQVDAFLYFRVLPAARNAGVEADVIAWATEHVRAVGRATNKPAVFRSQVREEDAARRADLDRHGFANDRYFFRMECSLEAPIPAPEFPAGITLRHNTGSDGDVAGWVAAYNQSFIDHWNFHQSTEETHRHHLSDSKYRADLDLLAVAEDGTVAAFTFCLIDNDANQRTNRHDGWIELLGTRRGFRKQGLGRAMLLAGMQRLRDVGMTRVRLGVDAANPSGALRLYQDVGFSVTYANMSFVKQL